MQLNGVSFERCLTPPDAVGQPIICVFSDASEEAFGACAYARWQLSSGEFGVRFIAAKSRVAPLKRLTIPQTSGCSFGFPTGQDNLRRMSIQV